MLLRRLVDDPHAAGREHASDAILADLLRGRGLDLDDTARRRRLEELAGVAVPGEQPVHLGAKTGVTLTCLVEIGVPFRPRLQFQRLVEDFLFAI